MANSKVMKEGNDGGDPGDNPGGDFTAPPSDNGGGGGFFTGNQPGNDFTGGGIPPGSYYDPNSGMYYGPNGEVYDQNGQMLNAGDSGGLNGGGNPSIPGGPGGPGSGGNGSNPFASLFGGGGGLSSLLPLLSILGPLGGAALAAHATNRGTGQMAQGVQNGINALQNIYGGNGTGNSGGILSNFLPFIQQGQNAAQTLGAMAPPNLEQYAQGLHPQDLTQFQGNHVPTNGQNLTQFQTNLPSIVTNPTFKSLGKMMGK
jgi:hypothetical protein